MPVTAGSKALSFLVPIVIGMGEVKVKPKMLGNTTYF